MYQDLTSIFSAPFISTSWLSAYFISTSRNHIAFFYCILLHSTHFYVISCHWGQPIRISATLCYVFVILNRFRSSQIIAGLWDVGWGGMTMVLGERGIGRVVRPDYGGSWPTHKATRCMPPASCGSQLSEGGSKLARGPPHARWRTSTWTLFFEDMEFQSRMGANNYKPVTNHVS